MDLELEKQLQALEGLANLEIPTTTQVPQALQPTPGVETAETLLGEVPFVPAQPTVQQVSVQPTTTAQPTVQQVSNTTVVATPQPSILNDEPVFINNIANTGFQTQTEFFKLKEGEKTKVTLVSPNKFIRGRVHYIEGLGMIKCLSKYDELTGFVTEKHCCCIFPKKDGSGEERSKQRLLVPVIEYPVSKADGKTIIQGQAPVLKMWNMNVLEERALKEILINYAENSDDTSTVDVTTFDLNLSKVRTNDFPTISMVPMSPSVRAKFPMIESIVAGIDNDFYKNAYKEFARTVSEETVRNILVAKQNETAYAQQLENQQVIDINQLGI